MRIPVVLSLRGTQYYPDQEPETIELVTDGVMVPRSSGWDISYEESELTGMEGVLTTFRVAQDKITLKRTGKLRSEMVFREGYSHESLYQLDFGAMLITVCAVKLRWDLSESGGTIDMLYTIDIENAAAGRVDYHLDIRAK